MVWGRGTVQERGRLGPQYCCPPSSQVRGLEEAADRAIYCLPEQLSETLCKFKRLLPDWQLRQHWHLLSYIVRDLIMVQILILKNSNCN